MATGNALATSLADKGLVTLLGQRLTFIEPDLYTQVENVDKTFRQPLSSSVTGQVFPLGLSIKLRTL